MNINIESISGKILLHNFACSEDELVYDVICRIRKQTNNHNIMNLTSYKPCYRVLRQNKTLRKEKIKDGMSISYYVNMEREETLKKVQNNGLALKYASDELKNDREVVLKAVQQFGWALEFASDELKNDKEVVLEAVQEYGYALEYASNKLKNDREVVLIAVQQNGDALEFASDELKNDKYVVLKAVQLDGDALEFASDELKNDKEIVKAFQNYWDSFQYASALNHASD